MTSDGEILMLRPRTFAIIPETLAPQLKRVDLCMTNGSKVMIYLTLLYFKFYCTLVSNAKGDLAKSNKQ